jgi:CRISPR-associated protein Csy1
MNNPLVGYYTRTESFRSAIEAFIEARRDTKFKGKQADADAAAKYDYTTWLADAAHRVGQIQAVTHVLKATHPDARGTSLHVAPGKLVQHAEIGTHVLGNDCAEDIVGNAAALDVFKFLKIEVDGRRLLDWMQAGDADLARALNPDAATANGWMQTFSGLVRVDTAPVSHPLAKQVYWLVGDEPANDAGYHLLAPLFPSSLVHAVHNEIQDARFGDTNKLARQARHDKKPHEQPYRAYAGLVARKLGGTKPQNVSQLNSERGGVNYLLASLPPAWELGRPRTLLKLDTAMDRLAYFKDEENEEDVRHLVKSLADFLLTDPPPNDATRTRRRAIEQELGGQLALFGTEIHARFEPGWTRNPDCALPLCEQLWLDPERTELPVRDDTEHPEWTQQDRDFNEAYTFGDWPDQVAGRFAHWVNGQLHKAGLTTVGEAEYRHWARQAIIDAAWPVPMQRRAPHEEKPL